jgi:FtsP/CotA-like multicopper oxidase with cupredoxin domain
MFLKQQDTTASTQGIITDLDQGKIDKSRRKFVQGVAAGGALMATGLGYSSMTRAGYQQPQILTGNHFSITIDYKNVNFTGADRIATAINGSVPAPVLRWRQGQRVTLDVTNNLAVDSSIHWHGLILPSAMDGVPGISNNFQGIKPGETFRYEFDVQQSGTYWYHSHSAFQEQTGAYGAIIIDPIEPMPVSYDREHVIVLSDWSDEAPENIYAKLKKMSHYYNRRERTVSDLWEEIQQNGLSQTWNDRSMWNDMRMSDRDISDVTGYTYTFLMNGNSPVDNWTGTFKKGERLLLRVINASAMTLFDVRIPGLKMTVVAADGQYVDPVSVDEFRIGVAETYDVLVTPDDDMAYSVFAQAIDRSGYASGRLTSDISLQADVPPMDYAPILTHGDMGMGGMDHSNMDHSNMSAEMMAMMAGGIKHADGEYGPHVDMLAENPQYRLDDPGVGLRNNGRRVLTYADLRNLQPTPDPREPAREIELHLTGSMRRYMWSIDGIKFADAEPLMMKFGERLRITLVNDTMMNHPIHLHGVWSDLETGDDKFIPRKHTVIVQPGAKISYRVTADALGSWAYHCHLLYHMPGMFRQVVIA